MAAKIKGNNDGPNGENLSYSVQGRNIPKNVLIPLVEAGKYPGYHVLTADDGKKWIRGNPDKRKNNNVNS